jgi:hypothetical protein
MVFFLNSALDKINQRGEVGSVDLDCCETQVSEPKVSLPILDRKSGLVSRQ